MLADRMVQLDHMTRGRAMFGVGPGALVHDAKKIGIDPADQRRMMNESLDVQVALMRGESVTRKTDWFDLQDARLQLPCYTQPMMEMAVAAARSPSGALAAGRHGIGMLSIGGTSDDAMKHHAENWELYEEQARLNGQGRGSQELAAGHAAAHRRNAREGAAEREVRPAKFRDYFDDVATFPIVPAGITDPFHWFVESGAACIGTPDDAIAFIERLLKGSGGFGVIMELAQNWADWEATKRHYELMARYVHPHFQRSREWRRESYDYRQGAPCGVHWPVRRGGAGGNRSSQGAARGGVAPTTTSPACGRGQGGRAKGDPDGVTLTARYPSESSAIAFLRGGGGASPATLRRPLPQAGEFFVPP